MRGNDLWVYDLATKAETRLTSDGSATVLNGALSWVYWEEIFDHAEAGYWWSDDSQAIAFLRTDEEGVDLVTFPEVLAGGAGDPDAALSEGRQQESGRPPRHRRPRDRKDLVDERGRGTNTSWACGGCPTAAPWRSRRPTGLRRVSTSGSSPGTTAATRHVLTDLDDAWVNQKELQFLDGGKKFLLTSERDGHTHLYLYDIDGNLLNAVTRGPWSVRGPSGLLRRTARARPGSTSRAAGSTSRRSRSRPSNATSTGSVWTAPGCAA